MTNYCYCFIVEEAKKTTDYNREPSEDIEIYEVSQIELIKLLENGMIVEADMRTALYRNTFIKRIEN